MTDNRSPENYMALVARSLAELVDRLRHSVDEPIADTWSPVSLARLRVCARLLPLLESHECQRLATALEDLIEVLGDSPGRDLSYLDPCLETLAQVLEEAFQEVDRGCAVADLGTGPAWLAALSRLATAGTPLEVMDDLDSCAHGWEERWGDGRLPPAVERELRQRWLTYRDYGDAVFGSGPSPEVRLADAIPPASSGGELHLLLDSRLRREQLVDRLRGWGYDLRALHSAEEAAAIIRHGEGDCRAILCDQLVPGRNLGQLVRLRRQMGIGFPTLVLVTSGTGEAAVDLQRARALGADLVWTEPFQRDPLAE